MAQSDLEIDFPVGRPIPWATGGTMIDVILFCKKCNRRAMRKIRVQCLGDEREFICITCEARKVMKVRPKLLTHV